MGLFSLSCIYDIVGLSDNYINVYANYLANHRLPMTCNKKMQYLLRRAQRSKDGGMVESSPADHVISVIPCSPLILSASSQEWSRVSFYFERQNKIIMFTMEF